MIGGIDLMESTEKPILAVHEEVYRITAYDNGNGTVSTRKEFVTELVRCRKCKHYKDGMCYNPNTYDDDKTCGNTTGDWFCADGIKKSD